MSSESSSQLSVQQSQQSQLSQWSEQSQLMPIERTDAGILSDKICAAADAAICNTLPSDAEQRDRAIFAFARALKAIPHLADAHHRSLIPHIRRWHKLARRIVGPVPFEETRIDFNRAWKRVIYPAGGGPLDIAMERARASAPPPEALEYEQDAIRLLASLCRELQGFARNGPFFLACRTAGRLFGADPTTAWRWLCLLVDDGLLELTERGTKKRASRYRYCGRIAGPQARGDPSPDYLTNS